MHRENSIALLAITFILGIWLSSCSTVFNPNGDTLLKVTWNPGTAARTDDNLREVVFLLKSDGSAYYRVIDSEGYPETGEMKRYIYDGDSHSTVRIAESLAENEGCQKTMFDVATYSISVIEGVEIDSDFQFGLCKEFDAFITNLTEPKENHIKSAHTTPAATPR